MKLQLDCSLADSYRSASQKIRVITESWVSHEAYCPACGSPLEQHEANIAAMDFFCSQCRGNYELKSKKNKFGKKIVDGAHDTMLRRLQTRNNPSLFLLTYTIPNYTVENFLVVPKYFVLPSLIERRKPLSSQARRSGWIGCNILLNCIPKAGRIFYVKDGILNPPKHVVGQWNKTAFIQKEERLESRGWLLDTMTCVDDLGKKEFTLDEVYQFEQRLSTKHPDNKHVRDKIRQQLQVLRDKGYLEFVSKGRYRLV